MTPPLMTADELLHASIPDKRTELVRGALIVREPAGYRHGRIAGELTLLLAQHAKAAGLGQIVSAETGFRLRTNPDTVRAPDIGFIQRDRLPDPQTRGFPVLSPDLVVEVLSPDDRPGETLAKIGDWLEAGARLVWVIDPERRLARVYRLDGTESILGAEDTLDGEDVVAGFTCTLGAIL